MPFPHYYFDLETADLPREGVQQDKKHKILVS